MVNTADTPEVRDDIPEQLRVRRDKRERMLDQGAQPYPINVPRTHTLAQVRQNYPELEAGTETDDVVSVTGRVMFVRLTGKLCFASLAEGSGATLQVMVSLKEVGDEAFEAFKRDLDLGDLISVTGRVIASKRGELSVMASSWCMASKSLRPLPVLHKELSEESRVRRRYTDLIVRPDAMRMATLRPAVLAAMRDYLGSQGFTEIETPMLQTIPGGAAARPFVTYHNAAGMDLYLRIAPELYLKRALVGGMERVFEINRNFRNEGLDSTHSAEFAMLEFYCAYADYRDGMRITREMVQSIVESVTGGLVAELLDGTTVDFSGEWSTITMYGSLSDALGESITPATDDEYLRALCEKREIKVDPKTATHGKYIEELWEDAVLPTLDGPTFVIDFPADTTPLTKAHREVQGVTEKWDLYVCGFELGTGYSELNDPVVQREKLQAQAALGDRGDDEAMRVDEDFLEALEHGMPPAAGVGMGIDRLLMALTGMGIRETILFPLVKPVESVKRAANQPEKDTERDGS